MQFKVLPYSLNVGTLGITGLSAYFGLSEVAKPKAGETSIYSFLSFCSFFLDLIT